MTGPPVRDLWHLLTGPAEADPERPALIIAGVTTTYGQLEQAVGTAAARLAGAGVRPGWRVPVIDDTSVPSVAALLALPRVGAAAALMNPRLTAEELAVLAEVAGAAPVAVVGPAVGTGAPGAGGATLLDGTDLLTAVPGTVPGPPAGAPDPAAEAVVLFTSGTTGRPKAVAMRHGILAPRVAAFAPTFDPGSPAAVTMMCVPLVHVGGMLGLLVSLARGQTTVVQTRFDAGGWLALVARYRVATAFLVPTMLHRILDHPSFADTDLSSLTLVTYGAAPAPPALVRRAMAALPHVQFANTFGQTETLGSITTLGPDDHTGDRLASVGRPLPGVTVRVVEPGSAQEVTRGAVGELWVKTAASVLPEATGGSAPPDGWLATGDLVAQDADGYLYPRGRLSDTINRGGEKFAPAEIEAVLVDHPAVAEAAVAGVADQEMGQRVGAAVVARSPVSADELREFCRSRLAAFKLPERIVFVTELPYNDFGKVGRRQLEALLGGEP